MPWMKLDDQVAFHAKIVKAGNEAVGAWVRAGAWSCGAGTLGFIPEDMATTIAPERVWIRLANAWVRPGGAGLAERVEGGWQIHDHAVYNPAQERAARRAKVSAARAEAGRRGAAARWQTDGKRDGKPVAIAMSDASQTDDNGMAPIPIPIPIPEPSGEGSSRAGARTPARGNGSGNGNGSAPPRGRHAPPDDVPITAELVAACEMAGARAPTRDDVQACLADARSKGETFADWHARIVRWMCMEKRFGARRGVKAAHVVQGVDPNSEWFLEAKAAMGET